MKQSTRERNKNIAIAILLAYVVIDLLLPILAGTKYCSLLEEFSKSIGKTGNLISLVLGVVAAVIVYQLLERQK